MIAASLSIPRPRGKSGHLWQYHSRSDLHSKVACWGVLFDLLQQSRVLRGHGQSGKVIFGVNFEMRDFSTGRKKKLDLVVARPSAPVRASRPRTLEDLAAKWFVVLTSAQKRALLQLPPVYEGPVGAVLMALEAKAAMTEHGKAQPRLYDELNSSHLTVHGASRQALAVGLVMVNVSTTFVSPDLNPEPPGAGQPIRTSTHVQPTAAAGIIRKVREIPRRTGVQAEGYDGLGVVVVSAPNDGVTPVTLVRGPPAPARGDVLHYETMVTRVANEYDTRFGHI